MSATWMLLHLLIWSHFPATDCGRSVVKLGYLVADNSSRMVKFKQARVISGAFSYAVEQINNDTDLLPHHRLEFVWDDSEADELKGLEKLTYQWKNGVKAFFGPEIFCRVAAKLAAAWNLPIMSYKCADHEVSNKTLYPTFTRTFPPNTQVTKFIISLLLKHKWRKFSLIAGSTHPFRNIAERLQQVSKEHNLTLNSFDKYTEPYISITQQRTFSGIVEKTYQLTRVYVFLGSLNAFVDFIINMHKRGLLETGDYTTIYVDQESYDKDFLKYFKRTKDDPHSIQFPTKVSRTFLIIVSTPSSNTEYDDFREKVEEYNKRFPFNFRNPFSFTKSISVYAAYLYDAVFLYARALDTIISRNMNITDGKAIADIIRNQSYNSILGFQSHIDENGDAIGNYSVLSGQPTNETFYIVRPIGSFSNPEKQVPDFQLFKDEKILWLSNNVPLDEPFCGYRHEQCSKNKRSILEIAFGSLAAFVLLTTFVVYIIYKKWRYEQEIAGLLWKVDINELHCFSNRMQPNENMSENKEVCMHSRLSLDSRMSMTQIYAQTGCYKGQIVALKIYEMEHFSIGMKMRKEMKMMRDLRHNNVNAFLGSCLDPPHFIIITEYCSKGSLQDVLENENFKIDALFAASFVKDIVQGMIFIHNSELHFHGNLKSSNCLINSRWTLQVADYGLLEVRSATYCKEDEYAYYRNLLWTAPEHIQNNEQTGSQKGDIYSFGFILYEIFGRMGPSGSCQMNPKSIIQMICQPVNGSFRPNTELLDCDPYITDCIHLCWAENPAARPDFRDVWKSLHPMREKMKRNIFENMMAMMEGYQKNLEDLVTERTEQLNEEKRKTEALLLRMLPKPVAEQLKRGESVKPEIYPCVTIYFSDICGFTALSAQSTPMQIVNLLNDLYTTFDSIIRNYDVYKVETIGDAYMVVSGLPIRNGDNHAGEIASMSLHLLSAIKTFKICHKKNETLKLRIGIHSGSCVAGVVGLIMPRYCLFGDTVNTASRMESNGEALRIHCGEQTKALLDKLKGYILQKRGLVNMKGKGYLRTYWLVGEDKEVRFHRLKYCKSWGDISLTSYPQSSCNDILQTNMYYQSQETESPDKHHSNKDENIFNIIRDGESAKAHADTISCTESSLCGHVKPGITPLCRTCSVKENRRNQEYQSVFSVHNYWRGKKVPNIKIAPNVEKTKDKANDKITASEIDNLLSNSLSLSHKNWQTSSHPNTISQKRDSIKLSEKKEYKVT